MHLGLGVFHRSHQAWYTDRVDELGEWGIAAFTGRSPLAAEVLEEQDGLYTLVERSASGDDYRVVQSLVEVSDGANLPRFLELMGAPSTAIVTLTVTEAGYHATAEGRLDTADAAARRDIENLTRNADRGAAAYPTTMPGRLTMGLAARRAAGAGPIAVVPCDNLSSNGAITRQVILDFIDATEPDLHPWVEENVAFVSTSVDRITPRITPADVEAVAASCGWLDLSPVITEPFSDWVLSGSFPAGRPAWENAGATFVDDIAPFENRKLWLLNGSHSLLAYCGLLKGHETVAEAINDAECLRWVEEFWDECTRYLPTTLDADQYRAGLLDRYRNSRIEHRLEQIASGGTAKLPVRLGPVLRAERIAGRDARASIRVVAAWLEFLRVSHDVSDPNLQVVEQLGRLEGRALAASALGVIAPDLADDEVLVGNLTRIIESRRA